ncbi:MAG: protein translocase SEC61 complex subunit gamma [Candidatus Pacearchaeota archaeon]
MEESNKPNMFVKLKSFYEKSKRVWLVLKKPNRKEFELTSKISAIGILILGVLGFAISILISFFF